MANPVIAPLLDHFAALSDPRQHAKVLYPLSEILLLVLSATIAGADDFVETTLWGTQGNRINDDRPVVPVMAGLMSPGACPTGVPQVRNDLPASTLAPSHRGV